MKIAIVTLCTANYECFGKHSLKINAEYAKRHNYDFHIIREKLSNDRSPQWDKLLTIEKYLSSYDWIFWIDADAIFLNFDIKLESFIFPSLLKDILICDDKPNGGLINTGTMFVKNSKWAKDFLQTWIDKGRQYDLFNKPLYDQDALVKMIKENTSDVLLHMLIYPGRAFNSYYFEKNPVNNFIWHLMASSNEEREKSFCELEKKLIGNK